MLAQPFILKQVPIISLHPVHILHRNIALFLAWGIMPGCQHAWTGSM